MDAQEANVKQERQEKDSIAYADNTEGESIGWPSSIHCSLERTYGIYTPLNFFVRPPDQRDDLTASWRG